MFSVEKPSSICCECSLMILDSLHRIGRQIDSISIFFYSSDMFHTIIIKSGNEQVKFDSKPITVSASYRPMKYFFSSSAPRSNKIL